MFWNGQFTVAGHLFVPEHCTALTCKAIKKIRPMSKERKNSVVQRSQHTRARFISSLTSPSCAKPRSSVHLFIRKKEKKQTAESEAIEFIRTRLSAPTRKQTVSSACRCTPISNSIV